MSFRKTGISRHSVNLFFTLQTTVVNKSKSGLHILVVPAGRPLAGEHGYAESACASSGCEIGKNGWRINPLVLCRDYFFKGG